jgi:hypothetical protein
MGITNPEIKAPGVNTRPRGKTPKGPWIRVTGKSGSGPHREGKTQTRISTASKKQVNYGSKQRNFGGPETRIEIIFGSFTCSFFFNCTYLSRQLFWAAKQNRLIKPSSQNRKARHPKGNAAVPTG